MITLPTLTWKASPNFSSRGREKTHLIVAHDCEGSEGGSIAWFQNPASKVSAHIVLSEDGARATQMVTWATKAWHACDFNPYSEGIEAAGYSAKGLGDPEWIALAAIMALRLKANGIICQRASVQNGWIGYCQHVDLGAEGGGHHDISSDPAVRAHFDQLIANAYGSEMPASWAPSVPVPFVPNPKPRDDLVVGSLEWVQANLNALGVAKPPLAIDGIDGPASIKAIKQFQAAHSLDVDGDAGPKTSAAIEAALAEAKKPTNGVGQA